MIEGLLKSLVAKAGLTYEEIADCYTKRNAKRHAQHLDVTSEGERTRYTVSCGHNPYAIAVVNHGGIELEGDRCANKPDSRDGWVSDAYLLVGEV